MSKLAGSRSRKAAAITLCPWPSMRVTASSARFFRLSSHATLVPAERAVAVRLITAGAAPLTKQRTTSLPDASVVELKVAISL